ncbi:MAG: apolipoprotein N-acyltransferase [Gammaproteobacteria bacterium]|nr:apolipoprotein N-acyltransferase [Gammaproteobacteria bacterium]
MSAGIPAGAAPLAARAPVARAGSPAVRLALALLGGSALAAAFAPLTLWPLAILAPALLMWLWQDAQARESARLAFAFSFGTFACGTYWLYHSVHVIGGAPLWLAFVLMLGLAAAMGLFYAALGYVAGRWLPQRGAVRWLLALPAAWLLLEWFRGWFLSGFSWLSLGYSQSDTWLAGVSPLLGVYGISALLLLQAGALVTLCLGTRGERLLALAALALPWMLGAALYGHDWTHPSAAPLDVAIVQGAVPQDEKWLEQYRASTLERYEALTGQLWGARLIVWPESATASLANDITDYLSRLYGRARDHRAALVMGILRADNGPDGVRYYNSVLALDAGVSWYDKRHLVPFAEFFPVPHFVRSWLRLMSLPYSDFTRGRADQAALPAAGLHLGTTICYEDAYGSAMLPVLHEADVLVNVTNDAWFGDSSARHQHFQIARFRALEAGRYLVRAANDGISAVIGPHGEVVARAAEFTPQTLRARITPMQGLTPYAYVGNWLAVGVMTLVLAYSLWLGNDRARRARKTAPDQKLTET